MTSSLNMKNMASQLLLPIFLCTLPLSLCIPNDERTSLFGTLLRNLIFGIPAKILSVRGLQKNIDFDIFSPFFQSS